MKVRKIVAAMAAMSMLAAFSAQTASAAGAVTLAAEKVNVEAGSDFELKINIGGLPDTGLSVLEFAVKYDSSKITINSIDAGTAASTGVDAAEVLEGATAFSVQSPAAGTYTVTYSTGKSDKQYCISKEGDFAVIKGTVPAGTAAGEYAVELVAIDRETTQGSGTKNTEIVAGYIDANDVGTKYEVTATAGAVIVGDGETDPTPSQGGDVLYGDCDVDGDVDIMDVIAINKAILGSASLSDQGKTNADVDLNQAIDTTDALNILKNVVKLIELPVKS